MKEEQVIYVVSQFNAGFDAQSIRTALHGAGYDEQLAGELLTEAQKRMTMSMSDSPKKKGSNFIMILAGVLISAVLVTLLLVVVVQSSLNTSRDKGTDAAIKSNLNSARIFAEIYYDENKGSYAGACDSFTSLGNLKVKPICEDLEEVYAIEAQLNNGEYYCVDSTGFAEIQSESALTGSPRAGGGVYCNEPPDIHAEEDPSFFEEGTLINSGIVTASTSTEENDEVDTMEVAVINLPKVNESVTPDTPEPVLTEDTSVLIYDGFKQMQDAAEQIYVGTGSYDRICSIMGIDIDPTVYCNVSKEAYVITIKPAIGEGYACVDSTGFIGVQLTLNESATTCAADAIEITG